MNKILFKVFDAMCNDSYSYIYYECFGIDNADQFIRKRQDKFINKFCVSDNLLCRVILADVNFELSFLFLSILFSLVCSFILFNLLYFLLPHVW